MTRAVSGAGAEFCAAERKGVNVDAAVARVTVALEILALAASYADFFSSSVIIISPIEIIISNISDNVNFFIISDSGRVLKHI